MKPTLTESVNLPVDATCQDHVPGRDEADPHGVGELQVHAAEERVLHVAAMKPTLTESVNAKAGDTMTGPLSPPR